MPKLIKATMHNGKGNRKHPDHEFMAEDKKDVVIKTQSCTLNLPETDDMIDMMYQLLDLEAELTGKCADDEVTFYRNLYGETYKQQMLRYREKSNYARIKSFTDWMSSKNLSPIETILQIGKKDCQIPSGILEQCCDELHEWEKQTLGRNLGHISTSLHRDETTDHIHDRNTIIFWDEETGLPYPCVKKGLEQAGIPLYNPDKPETKYNSRLKKYDTMRREKWYDIVEKHLPKDFVLDRTPDRSRKLGHVTVEMYKIYEEMNAELDARSVELDARESRLNEMETALDVAEINLFEKEDELQARETRLKAREDVVNEREKNYKATVERAVKMDYTARVEELNNAIRANNELIRLGKQKEAELQAERKANNRQTKRDLLGKTFASDLERWERMQQQQNDDDFQY